MRCYAPLIAALAASVSATTPTEGSTKMFTLETAPGKTVEVTEEEKFEMMDNGVHFFDITEFNAEPASLRSANARAPFPTESHHRCAIEQLIKKLDMGKVKSQLEEFSAFHNRYYLSRFGVEAAEWLYEQVREVLDESGNTLANVRYVRHMAWSQPSVVVTIPGRTQRTVIVGAHLDSVISGDRGAGRAPGADDNGSGSLMILDVLRSLLTDPRIADNDLQNTIEFHWYGAEEAGLLGSQDIFTQYAAARRDVVAMLNQDMVGYKGRDGVERFGLITDWTDPAQNDYLKLLIGNFTSIPYEESQCGYACSDHASANRNGFPSSFVFETPFGNHNPRIHTPNDTIDHVDFDHVLEHAKLTTAFMYELAYWTFQ